MRRAALLLLTLSSCAGGGGSSAVPAGGAPPPSPSPAITAAATGTVLDLGAARYSKAMDAQTATPLPLSTTPVPGATVIIGPALILGPTPPPTLPFGDVATTTSASGTFTASGFATGAATYVMVFPKAGDPHVPLREDAAISDGRIRTLYLTTLSAGESAFVDAINADRARYGAPAASPDEAFVEAARYWADFMAATGYFAHCIPASACIVVGSTPAPPPRYAPQDVDPDHRYHYLGGLGAQYLGGNPGENLIAGYANAPSAETALMGEAAACTVQPATYATCPFNAANPATQTGHFLNIVNPAHALVGVGENLNGTYAGFAPFPYFDQEFL